MADLTYLQGLINSAGTGEVVDIPAGSPGGSPDSYTVHFTVHYILLEGGPE